MSTRLIMFARRWATPACSQMQVRSLHPWCSCSPAQLCPIQVPPASTACGKQGALINVRNRSSSIHQSKQFRVAFTLGKVNLYLSGKPIRDSRAELVMESFLYMNPLRSVCSIASSISEIVAVPPALLHVVACGGHGSGGLVLVARGGRCGAVGSRPVRRCCVLKRL